jgi:hypothetical protein
MFKANWALIPLEGSRMDKVNLPFFYSLGAQLSPVTKMTVDPKNRPAIVIAVWPVRDTINALLAWRGSTLNVCRPSAQAFLNAVNEVSKWWGASKPED